jgi:glutathione synthase/RimK-type ligase-like ATP-grasp enzyme
MGNPIASSFPVPQIVVDRHPNRQIARSVLATCRALGVPALSAGIAATGDRLDVASALAAHGLPRPATALCTSEDAALAAVAALGLPATLLPLDLQTAAIPLLDLDTAEAILEHRAVLGGSGHTLGLIQAGAPHTHSTDIIVVDGTAIAFSPSPISVSNAALRLAEEAALALRADLIGISIAIVGGQPVVWDVQPVPEFRSALLLTDASVAEIIAGALALRLPVAATSSLLTEQASTWISITREGIHSDVVVSA